MSEFPKMLYRDGSRFLWLGLRLDTRVVGSAVEQEEAFADGWHEGETVARIASEEAESLDADIDPDEAAALAEALIPNDQGPDKVVPIAAAKRRGRPAKVQAL